MLSDERIYVLKHIYHTNNRNIQSHVSYIFLKEQEY